MSYSIPGKALSYWLDTSTTTTFPSLEINTSCDVVIVGGGIVGITTAYLL